MQRALAHSSGNMSAVVFFSPKSGATDEAIENAVRNLIRFGEGPPSGRPTNVYTLVALEGALLDRLWSKVGNGSVLKSTPLSSAAPTPGELLVQVAAQTQFGRLYALRTIQSMIADAFDFSAEWTGERILHGMEPFGFRDSRVAAQQVQSQVGTLSEGCWLLCARIEQDVAKFFALGEDRPEPEPTIARAVVMGAEPALRQLSPAENAQVATAAAEAANSHLDRMRMLEQSPEWKIPIVRRGFPYRRDGKEGLVFVAAAADYAPLAMAHAHFSDGPLKNYATEHEAGLYYCPQGTFLSDAEPAIPKSAAALDPGENMLAYEVTEADQRYFTTLLNVGAWPGPIGAMSLNNDVRQALRVTHALLANGNQNLKQSLDSALDDFEAASNRVNKRANLYVTKG